MTNSLLVLARHGQTVTNLNNCVHGQSDAPLTEKGKADTARLAELLRPHGVARILAGPLGRAQASAAIYADVLGLTVETLWGMTELSSGSWEGKPKSEVTGGRNILRPTWDVRPPGGESYRDAEPRVHAAIEHLKRNPPTGPTLLVAHGSVNRVFVSVLLQLDPSIAQRLVSAHEVVHFLPFRTVGKPLFDCCPPEEVITLEEHSPVQVLPVDGVSFLWASGTFGRGLLLESPEPAAESAAPAS